jgi:hypothetical protein
VFENRIVSKVLGSPAQTRDTTRVPEASGPVSQREGFFRELPELSEFSHAAELQKYADAPLSWHVVITDVRGSTRAIEAGRYRDVNALGVSSIVAVQNALPDLEVPYVFGGDGATLLVPGSRLPRVEAALRGVRRMARDAFDLELRAATVRVAELQSAGERVGVARFRASPSICLALFAGSGFARAERWVKDPTLGERFVVSTDGEEAADLEGFECRWRPLESRFGSVISLLVFALSEADSAREATYKRAISAIERVLAGRDARPVRLDGLRMLGVFGDFSTEARVRSGSARGPAFDAAGANARKKSVIGRTLMAFKKSAGGFEGESYRAELVENTDFRKFDETLRMVLDVSDLEIDELLSHLEREHEQGLLVYGLHRSKSALMTCFVRAYRGNHVHFVDGSDGGYALAAKALKAQLAEIGRRPSELPLG